MASPFDQCSQNYKYFFQPDLLKGKVALITGGGSGIGFTITEILMRHGCRTAIASRSKARTMEAAERLEKGTGGKCLPLAMDVRKPAEVIEAVDAILKEYGKIDILVNNAAGNFLVPLSGMSYNAFKTVLDIDTVGTFNCSKTVYDKWLKEHGGVILNISATLPYRGTLMQGHAGPAKAAIDALTRHMAVEWGPQNIRVIGLAPGPIAETEGMRKLGEWGPQNIRVVGLAPGPIAETEGMRKLGGVSASVEEVGRVELIPLQRFGDKREMAHAVLFFVSDACPYITGETVVADGGSWMTDPNNLAFFTMRMEAARSYESSKRQSKL